MATFAKNNKDKHFNQTMRRGRQYAKKFTGSVLPRKHCDKFHRLPREGVRSVKNRKRGT